MKKTVFILILCLGALLNASCTMESIVEGPDGQDVIISLAAATRGTAAGDPEDSYINTLRVLGYGMGDQRLAFNEKVTVSGAGNYTINVKTGTYRLVFIANEHSDAALSAKLDGITPTANNTLPYLREQCWFNSWAFGTNTDIPMAAIKENIVIQGDDKMLENNAQPLMPWKVALDRLAVRLDITLTMPSGQFDAWYGTTGKKEILIGDIPDRTYLFPGTDNSYRDIAIGYEQVVYTGANPAAVDGKKTVTLPRAVILPERVFTPVDAKAKGLTISLTDNMGERKGTISSGETGWGYTLPRNTYLDVKATVAGPPELDFEFTTTVVDWDDITLPSEGH